ncbi:rhodanese-related sulfurtransferase [Puniceicoccaceae bacterium K14]|nr:rhodanese-related sulfurtransferase [Puniceicoccaceae bacterium K14]
MSTSSAKTLVVAYYKFVSLPDFRELRYPLLDVCEQNGVKGTILLAAEGINSTMAGPEEGVAAVLDYLQSNPAIGELTVKRSFTDEPPFYRMKVKLKEEIVRLGLPEVNPNDQVGEYVAPEAWNKLISDPDVVLVDTRNDYEVEIGTFKGAIDPNTKSFREFPEYVEKELADKKDKPIAMFCTGGIRCEKSTSYLLKEGFKKVYHLDGGILNYLEKVDPEESMWKGDCFVFDNRVTVNHNLEEGDFDQCHACRHAITELDMASEKYVEGISCPHCFDTMTEEQRERMKSRQRQVEISREQNRPHIGSTPEQRKMWREEKMKRREEDRRRTMERNQSS